MWLSFICMYIRFTFILYRLFAYFPKFSVNFITQKKENRQLFRSKHRKCVSWKFSAFAVLSHLPEVLATAVAVMLINTAETNGELFTIYITFSLDYNFKKATIYNNISTKNTFYIIFN